MRRGNRGARVGDADTHPDTDPDRHADRADAVYRGVDALPASEPVGADELKAIAEAQGVEVRPWDVVLIRTVGGLAFFREHSDHFERHVSDPDLRSHGI